MPGSTSQAQSDGGQRDQTPTPRMCFGTKAEYWSVVFEGQIVRVRDMRGVQVLARLLASPGREFHVVDLVAVESGGAETAHALEPGMSARDEGDAGEVLDARAKNAYRRRLTEITDDLEEARTLGDTSRVRRQRPNWTSFRASCPERSGSEGATDAWVRSRSAPEPV